MGASLLHSPVTQRGLLRGREPLEAGAARRALSMLAPLTPSDVASGGSHSGARRNGCSWHSSAAPRTFEVVGHGNRISRR